MPRGRRKTQNLSVPRPGPSSSALQGLEFDARREQRLKTAEKLQSQRTHLQVIEVAEHAAGLADRSIQTAIRQSPPDPSLACREGCAWCCHKLVGTTAPEVFIRRDEERKAMQDDRWTAARLPCSLLVDDRCSVYRVRPLTCRGFNSSDARQCEHWVKVRGQVEVPIYEPQHRLATFVLDGLRAGLAEGKLPNDLLELTAGLRIALTVPNAFDRWTAGDSIIAPARMR